MAHDRAGFGGGVTTVGLLSLCCLWCARPSRALRDALTVAAASGFGAAVVVHPVVGYTDLLHVGPAALAAALFALGVVLLGRATTGSAGRRVSARPDTTSRR